MEEVKVENLGDNIEPKAITTDEIMKDMAVSNPKLKEGMDKLKADEAIINPMVDEILKMLNNKMQEKDSAFELGHSFSALSKCITYLTTAVCNDYDHFQSEIKKAHEIVIKNIMPAIPDDDLENFTLRRLILTASCLIDYLRWRELLGDYEVIDSDVEKK